MLAFYLVLCSSCIFSCSETLGSHHGKQVEREDVLYTSGIPLL